MRKVKYPVLVKAEWAYIAGFFDGEGYVACKANGLTMTFVQKRPAVLEWIRSKIGGHLYPKSAPAFGYTLNVHGFDAAVILRRLFPYLIVKREEVYHATKTFWTTRKERTVWPPKWTVERRRRIKRFPTDRHKLTKEQREEVRRLYVPGKVSFRTLAKQFKVNHKAIGAICHDLVTLRGIEARWHYHNK